MSAVSNTNEGMLAFDEAVRKRYFRPLAVYIILAWFAEIMFIVVQGIILFPGAPMVHMLAWAFFCGLGMGAATGAANIFFVVDKYTGGKAIVMSTFVSVLTLNACNYICYELCYTFDYYGAREMGYIFLVKNFLLALMFCSSTAWLLFSEKGQKWVEKVGL